MTDPTARKLTDQYLHHRKRTQTLAQHFSHEDLLLQSMPDASPGKWHLAHTTWFFDTFLLAPHQRHYQPFDQHFNYLFNSYYDTIGQRHPRPNRGLLSRPSLDKIWDYRAHVDAAVVALIAQETSAVHDIITIGLHHEMQHQELMLTDLKHALAQNPYALPTLADPNTNTTKPHNDADKFSAFHETITSVGAHSDGFSYDCEQPRHRTWINAFSLRNTLVSNAEWLAFMADGGYRTPPLWLADGWAQCQQQHWCAPLYWQERDGQWFECTLAGFQPVNLHAPVCHISYYEADAFTRWAGWRLPTEFEWEHAASQAPIAGHFAESNRWHPSAQRPTNGPQQLFGDVWEWTASAFAPYPGFKAEQGALGEYNGKFMINQCVLRGGSCATAQAQMRASYRNFFYPHQRWQFSGLRPAR